MSLRRHAVVAFASLVHSTPAAQYALLRLSEMKIGWLFLAISIVALVDASLAYFDDEGYPTSEDDYSENSIDRFLQPAQKRACIRRGGNCDHRPNDCCYNSSCRCNLWGANCRCQRMGLFQKWG
ncbi:U8-agatoxin-Ao1a-like isoform X2 [Rhynchophorus ferrugineus]|uniref:U8-agatoxin-Ao1a-like isoform X2 n=1 Tax=Rhynchophorus ferrugineus TaxID=354439 RepID=UPI003FCD8A9A